MVLMYDIKENQNFSDFSVSANHSNQYNNTESSFYSAGQLCLGAVLIILFTIFGVVGNLISVIALLSYKKIQSATTSFIVSLCVADLIFCSFSMPLKAHMFIANKWPYSAAVCKLLAFVKSVNGQVCMFTILAITINRFLLIVYPKQYARCYNRRSVAAMIVVIWGVSFLVLSLPLFEVWGTYAYDSTELNCSIRDRAGETPTLFLFFTFLLTSSVLPICYVKIYLVVRNASTKAQREDQLSPRNTDVRSHSIRNLSRVMHLTHKNEIRLLRVMTLVFISFLMSHLPMVLYRTFIERNNYPSLFLFCSLCFYFSSVMNPVIYVALSKEYRTAYRTLFVTEKLINFATHFRKREETTAQSFT